ncbi:MAG TPA: non-homologous end-joining DNA ligase, partial [Candidatus Acidoferrales bacterium]|nr:non-homologous end-joining DNA ligase [Candidatus Acidoferrales bacterium]
KIRPMLAQTADPFDSEQHVFEPKWDGMRCIAYVKDRKVELQNRNLKTITKSYPELEPIASNVKANMAVLDGEIVVLEKGLPSFELLQYRFGANNAIQIRMLSRRIPTTYIAFDLLHLSGRDLVDSPLTDRRQKLAKLIANGPHMLLSEYVPAHGKSYFRNALKLGFEGAMAKKADSVYQIGTRSEDWLKLKHVKTFDCVVAGYTVGGGSRSSTFGALVLAAYEGNGNIVHLGNVGTGFTDATILRLMKLLKSLLTKTKTVPGEVKAPAPIKWVKPQLVVEIGYMNLTRDRKLRLPRFERFRFDKSPSECIL